MRLKVLLPTGILIDNPVSKIVAEAMNGSFCLEPKHIDFVTALVPGVLRYVPDDSDHRSESVVLAIDQGTLVKCGQLVTVSVRRAVLGDNLESLRDAVRAQFTHLDEAERKARAALARLEAGVARQFVRAKLDERA